MPRMNYELITTGSGVGSSGTVVSLFQLFMSTLEAFYKQFEQMHEMSGFQAPRIPHPPVAIAPCGRPRGTNVSCAPRPRGTNVSVPPVHVARMCLCPPSTWHECVCATVHVAPRWSFARTGSRHSRSGCALV